MSASSGNDHARPRQYSGGKGECVKGGRREDVAERGVASIGVRWLFGLANLGERRHLACTTSRSSLYNICTLEHTRTQPRPARAVLLPRHALHPHKQVRRGRTMRQPGATFCGVSVCGIDPATAGNTGHHKREAGR